MPSAPAQGVPDAIQTPPPAHPGRPQPYECGKVALPTYIIEPPDVLMVESTQSLRDQPIRGQHLVRPDGTIGLGIYGSVRVGGLTIAQAQAAIARQIGLRVKDLDPANLSVDVLAYNSKYYFIITDGGGYGEQVYRLPSTGNETVLDAISLVNGLPPVASKRHIWVARPICNGRDCPSQLLPVDWVGITQGGDPTTNYQLLPNDRIYVKADRLITFDTRLAKILAPVERVLGITLLGSETVNSIKNRTTGVP